MNLFLSMTNLVLYQIYRSSYLKHGNHLENIENGKPVFTNKDTSDINRLVNFPIDALEKLIHFSVKYVKPVIMD